MKLFSIHAVRKREEEEERKIKSGISPQSRDTCKHFYSSYISTLTDQKGIIY